MARIKKQPGEPDSAVDSDSGERSEGDAGDNGDVIDDKKRIKALNVDRDDRCEIHLLPKDPKCEAVTEPLRRVEAYLDRNCQIIRDVNANQIEEHMTGELATANAVLIQELNENINEIVLIYNELYKRQTGPDGDDASSDS